MRDQGQVVLRRKSKAYNRFLRVYIQSYPRFETKAFSSCQLLPDPDDIDVNRPEFRAPKDQYDPVALSAVGSTLTSMFCVVLSGLYLQCVSPNHNVGIIAVKLEVADMAFHHAN